MMSSTESTPNTLGPPLIIIVNLSHNYLGGGSLFHYLTCFAKLLNELCDIIGIQLYKKIYSVVHTERSQTCNLKKTVKEVHTQQK